MAIDDVVNAGELNKWISIKKRTIVKNDFGEEIETFTTWCNVWAKMERKLVTSLAEMREVDEKLKIRNAYRITIRYLDGLREDMKIVYKTKTFRILNIENVFESDKKIILNCEEVI